MLTALFVVILLAGEEAAPTPKVTRPEWVAKPDGKAISKAFPDLAMRLGVGSRLKMWCDVTATGELTDCSVSEENPADMGFAAAAISLAPLFRMRETTADGRSVAGGRVVIPLVFQPLDMRAARPPRRYRAALDCVTWNRARLDILGDDETTLASRAEAKRLARRTGRKDRKPADAIEADIADAERGGEVARERMARIRSEPIDCLFLPTP